jgi:hypothetical protein
MLEERLLARKKIMQTRTEVNKRKNQATEAKAADPAAPE